MQDLVRRQRCGSHDGWHEAAIRTGAIAPDAFELLCLHGNVEALPQSDDEGVMAGVPAQSAVTLYGVMDEAVSYQTHTNPAGDSTWSLQQGNEGFLAGSRFGLLGNEDLGGGWKAGFRLENGFLANSGKLDQQGRPPGVREDRAGSIRVNVFQLTH